MACEKCGRREGHWRTCEIVAAFVADAEEIVGIKGWPKTNNSVGNVASYIEKNGYPIWYRPIAERQ